MVTGYKKEQAMSEKNRKNFSSQFKANVAIDAIREVKNGKWLKKKTLRGEILKVLCPDIVSRT